MEYLLRRARRTIGGALRMNAGCWRRRPRTCWWKPRRSTVPARRVALKNADFHFSYRHTEAPEDLIFIEAIFEGKKDEPAAILERIEALKARRETTQPIREKTGGSTFANPDPPGTPNQRSSWKLVDEAGMRGARGAGAQVSELHCNFLINTGDATAADIEGLGEDVRAAVKSKIRRELRWEIKRIGRPAHDARRQKASSPRTPRVPATRSSRARLGSDMASIQLRRRMPRTRHPCSARRR